MVEVTHLSRLEQAVGNDMYYACYKVNGITSWIYVDIDDFYNWLKNNIPEYSKEVRGRHFFFSKKSIVEDFNSKKVDRQTKARNAMSRYFTCCYDNNGLQDFNKMIDLQTFSPVFRGVQKMFLYNNNNFFLSTIDNKFMCEKFGYSWLNDLRRDVSKHGLSLFDDGAGHISLPYNFRTMFYDSGSSREMQFDRSQGRENVNSGGAK